MRCFATFLVVALLGFAKQVAGLPEFMIQTRLDDAIRKFQAGHLEAAVDLTISTWEEAGAGHARALNNVRALASQLALQGELELGCRVARTLASRTLAAHDLRHLAKLAPRCNATADAELTLSLISMAKPGLPEHEAEKLLFPQGDLLGLLDRVEDSFAKYSEANAVIHHRLDPGLLRDLLARTAEAQLSFTAARLAGRARGQQAHQLLRQQYGQTGAGLTQVFVLGFPRSGTSLVESIVSAHPMVKAFGEHSVLRGVERGLRAEADSIGTDLGLFLDTLPDRRLKQLAGAAQAALTGDQREAPPEHTHTTSSVPLDLLVAWLIPLLYPNAKIIWVRRCALDVTWSNFVQSFANTTGLPYAFDLVSIGRFFLAYEALMLHWQQVLPLPMFELRYEDLVTTPEASSRALLDFIELKWNPSVADFHATVRADGQVSTSSVFEVHQPVYSSAIGKWEKYATHLTPLVNVLASGGDRPINADHPACVMVGAAQRRSSEES